MPVATPIVATDAELAQVAYNEDGLVPAIVQEHGTGQVLMMAWMNEGSCAGRSRPAARGSGAAPAGAVVQGRDVGDRQWVRSAYDCDGDTLLFEVEQEGRGACHTGERSCFFRLRC